MNVDMILNSKVANVSEGPISTSSDSALKGSLCIKGDLSDLIKIMEAIRKDHLYPKVEIHELLKDTIGNSLDTFGERRVYFFNATGTQNDGRYNYNTGAHDLNKIECIKKIREVLGTGLKESKDFVDGVGRYLSDVEAVALKSVGIMVLARP
jgi:ribosomal protein L7/L12